MSLEQPLLSKIGLFAKPSDDIVIQADRGVIQWGKALLVLHRNAGVVAFQPFDGTPAFGMDREKQGSRPVAYLRIHVNAHFLQDLEGLHIERCNTPFLFLRRCPETRSSVGAAIAARCF